MLEEPLSGDNNVQIARTELAVLKCTLRKQKLRLAGYTARNKKDPPIVESDPPSMCELEYPTVAVKVKPPMTPFLSEFEIKKNRQEQEDDILKLKTMYQNTLTRQRLRAENQQLIERNNQLDRLTPQSDCLTPTLNNNIDSSTVEDEGIWVLEEKISLILSNCEKIEHTMKCMDDKVTLEEENVIVLSTIIRSEQLVRRQLSNEQKNIFENFILNYNSSKTTLSDSELLRSFPNVESNFVGLYQRLNNNCKILQRAIEEESTQRIQQQLMYAALNS